VTILLVEQNAHLALGIAQRGYVLETGSVVQTGTGQELLRSPEIRKAYLGE
jgi:branched-chain amino acid transport system ATP-binding protein